MSSQCASPYALNVSAAPQALTGAMLPGGYGPGLLDKKG